MTTVIAVEGEHDVLLGWDSQATLNGNESYTLMTPKVFARDGVVYGVSGALLVRDLLEVIDLPEYAGQVARKWIIKEWAPAFRAGMREYPSVWDSEDDTLKESSLILVVDGQVFALDSLVSPTQWEEGIYAIGSGGDYAKGALYHGADVMEALTVASSIDPFSGGVLTVTTASALLAGEGK